MRVDQFTIPLDDPLRLYATSIFRLRAIDAYTAETILPRGDVNLLFNFGPPITVTGFSSPAACTWRSAIVGGPQTRPLVSRPDREVHTIGVVLRLSTSFAFLKTPLEELTNGWVDASTLWSDGDRLLNQLAETASFQGQCELLVGWLRQQARLDEAGRIVNEACRLLRSGGASGAVHRTAVRLGTSPRQLQRLFAERVGISPAEYLQLSRFADALRLIGPARNLSEVAAQTDYFDQAHFCRDFRSFAGMTPDEYRQAAPRAPGLIFA